MARGIDSALLTALTQPEVQPFYAVEFLFSVTPLRFWTGYGDRDITVRGESQTFTGAATLLSISGMDEVKDLSAKSVTITLSGIESEAISLALAENYQRRTCRIYVGEQSVSSVVEVFTGRMDTMSIQDTGTTSTIELTVESNLVELERASNWRYTNDNHKSRHPDDEFFSYVQSIQDVQVAWGRKAS